MRRSSLGHRRYNVHTHSHTHTHCTQDVTSMTERMRAALAAGKSPEELLELERKKAAAKREVEDDGW